MIDPEEKRTPFLWPPEDCKVFWRHAQLPETSRRSHGQIFEVLLYRDNPALSQSWWCDVSFLVFLDNLKLRGYFDQMFLPFFTNGNARCEREWSLPRVNPSHPQTNHWTEMVQTGSNTFAAIAPVKICETVIKCMIVCASSSALFCRATAECVG